jgi:SAM-dependent methyltransferase
MSATDSRFAGSIPAIYDRYMAPHFFEPYAEDLGARLRDLSHGVVLEIAAGTGVVTRVLDKALPAAVFIVATDLNDAMLQIASTRLNGSRVTWAQADAQRLPFGDAVFDAVVCQFGYMFLPDRLAGYREAHRVLRAGGRLVFSVWDRIEANEVTLVAAQTVASMFPDDPPRFFERMPFGYYDPEAICAEVASAGFGAVEIESVEKVTRASSSDDVAVGLCKGTPLRTEIEARDPHRLDEATARVSEALAARFGRSSFDNRMRAHVIRAVCRGELVTGRSRAAGQAPRA